MSWSGNGNITVPSWSGNDVNKKLKNLNVDNINASSIHAYSGEFNVVDASVVRTGYMFLNDTIMTTFNNILYVNNEAVFVPSSFSTISDWSYFLAKSNVNMALFDLSNTSYVYAKNVVASNTVTTSNLNAPTISNVILNNVNVNSAFIYGRDIYSSTINTKIANIDLGIVSSLVASNAIIPKLNAYSIVNNTISSGSIFANNMSTTLLTANTINNVVISSSYISANTLYTSLADLPYIKGSSIEFTTALGRELAVSSILQNRSIYIPEEDDTDALIAFTNRDFSEFYGIITTSENRSSLSIAGTNNLGLLGVSTATLYGLDGVNIRTNPERAIQMTTTALIVDASGIFFNTEQFNTNAIMSTNVIYADLMIANIADFKVLNASTTTLDLVATNNINNSSNINTATLDVSGNASINNLTANGLTVNNSANYNSYISFGTSNSEFYGAQYLYDINSVRNLQVEKITVLGGWTGDDVLPPYYNDSIVEIGEDEIRPGQVIINGFNEDPLDLGIALTVRGDTQITQNLNVLGLTTFEGVVEAIGDLNVDGAFTAQGTADIGGIATVTGLLNALGGLGVEGEANFLGAVTAEAGIGVVGALGVTAGDITFGSPSNTGNIFTVHYTTNFSNAVNFGGDVNVGNINVDTLRATSTIGFNGSFDNINVSTLNGNKIILKSTDISPAQTLYYNSNNVLTGAVSLSDSNEITYTGFDKLKVSATNTMLLQTYGNININSLSTIFKSDVVMEKLYLSSLYGFNISQCNQVQHWNGTSYDYYIPQLSYTDLSNNTTQAVASDWAYYSAKKNLDMAGYNISNVGNINYNTLTATNVNAVNGFFSNITTSNTLTFRSPSSDTAAFRFSSFSYSNGVSNDILYFRKSAFLDNLGLDPIIDKNNLLNVQSTQYVDNSNFFCYLQFIDKEANVVITNSSNNYVTTYDIASHWSKYAATQTVNIASNNISNVNTLGLVSPYGFKLSQSNQIQHWNPGTSVYDYYIAQLSYTDISNNRTRAVASDWSYYPCENLILDMSGNYIINCGGLTLQTLGVGQATGGYINGGILFNPVEGDEVFWQISKPYITDPVLDPVGSEGIFIVERNVADGQEIAHGRIFDDGIYKPVIGSDLSNNVFVVGTLDMVNNNISNVNQMYYGSTRQPFIQYGDVDFSGGGTQTVDLDVPYVDSNYKVQATYSSDPGSNAKPIHIDSRTTSNFVISAQSGHTAFWTTFGNNN